MSSRVWWLGVAILVAAIGVHAAVPRYTWQPSPQYDDALIRVDRWTGRAELGVVRPEWGRWMSLAELRAKSAEDAAARRLVDALDRAAARR